MLLKIGSIKSGLKKPSSHLVNLSVANRSIFHFSRTFELLPKFVLSVSKFFIDNFMTTKSLNVKLWGEGGFHGNSFLWNIYCSSTSIRAFLLSFWELATSSAEPSWPRISQVVLPVELAEQVNPHWTQFLASCNFNFWSLPKGSSQYNKSYKMCRSQVINWKLPTFQSILLSNILCFLVASNI